MNEEQNVTNIQIKGMGILVREFLERETIGDPNWSNWLKEVLPKEGLQNMDFERITEANAERLYKFATDIVKERQEHVRILDAKSQNLFVPLGLVIGLSLQFATYVSKFSHSANIKCILALFFIFLFLNIITCLYSILMAIKPTPKAKFSLDNDMLLSFLSKNGGSIAVGYFENFLQYGYLAKQLERENQRKSGCLKTGHVCLGTAISLLTLASFILILSYI
jgi:hypothetical protein